MGRWPKFLRATSLAGALLNVMATSSATAAPPSQISSGNDIIVSADRQERPLGEVIKDFSGKTPDEQVAWWQAWVCVRVEGLISPHAKFLEQRVGDTLRKSGVRVLTKENCYANVEIVFPPDSDAYAQWLHHVRPGLYRDLDRKGFPPPEMVNQFLKPRAVRWLPVLRDLGVGTSSTDNDPRIIGFPDASHITINTGAVKIGEVVVVDYRRLHHITWDQLADYISMVVLTDPDMDTEFSHDSTILALFASPDDGSRAPPEMTDRDRLIVQGFQRMDQLAKSFAQRDAIARTVQAGEAQPATK